MKRVISTFAFILFATATFAQNGVTSLALHGTFAMENVSTIDAIVGGPGAGDIAGIDLFFDGNSHISLSKSAGNTWSGMGYVYGGSSQPMIINGDPDIPYRYVLEIGGIARIQHNNGNISSWGFLFQLGTGTRTTTGQASTKAELL